jgi:glycerophosphoryl diester phosphodiesterase
VLLVAALVMGATAAFAYFAFSTAYPTPMISGSTANTTGEFDIEAIFTVGEVIDGYTPPGILDGMSAFEGPDGSVRVLVHHELNADTGYPYELSDGSGTFPITGARISYFDIDPVSHDILAAGPAYDRAYDRYGALVTSPAQINEAGDPLAGFARFCSGAGFAAGTYGFVDDIHFANEENSNGSVWAVDVAGRDIWAAPALGRGAWENVTALETGRDDMVALLLGDDTAPAPLYLYVGQKGAIGDGSFLDRNGLAVGQLYVWVADGTRKSRATTPEDFNGGGSSLNGNFRKVRVQQNGQAGKDGYDAQGYLDDDTLRGEAAEVGAFFFSRPEDVATNPVMGNQAVLASTGRGQLYPSDDFGALYIVTVDFSKLAGEAKPNNIGAGVAILYDGDDAGNGDFGIRSPDNLDWADDGFIYVQEDRSTALNVFGGASGVEASIWKIDPFSAVAERIGEMDRSVVVPVGSTDGDPTDLGDWETSGILDVTGLFGGTPGVDTILIGNVQAHSVRDGLIGGSGHLVQGGQLIILTKVPPPAVGDNE